MHIETKLADRRVARIREDHVAKCSQFGGPRGVRIGVREFVDSFGDTAPFPPYELGFAVTQVDHDTSGIANQLDAGSKKWPGFDPGRMQ